jgi:hypothetical protein
LKKYNQSREIAAALTPLILSLLALITIGSAWVTHVVVCIQEERWFLLGFGILVPPIGWVHGFLSWFGFW